MHFSTFFYLIILFISALFQWLKMIFDSFEFYLTITTLVCDSHVISKQVIYKIIKYN